MSPPLRTADRDTVRLVAEYSACEEIAILCAHLAMHDPRFAPVGRRAEDEQYRRKAALETAGLALRHPDERTAAIFGRTYQLPDVTASVVREIARSIPVAAPPPGDSDEPTEFVTHVPQEDTMQTNQNSDPNARLNGPHPAEPEAGGFLAFVKRQCTTQNGIIAGA
ncbi:MAG: hypothetical protein ABIR79_07790, partial [Candidatus Binatia bacterium]